MSFADALARKNASIFMRLGEAALWTPAEGAPIADIMVRRLMPDDLVRMGQSEIVMGTVIIRAQVIDVPSPAVDDVVTFFGAIPPRFGTNTFVISARPTFADPHQLVWECQAEPQQA